MTEVMIELTEDEFDAAYTLVPNHINPAAGWAVGDDGRGCLFETYGDELAFVRLRPPVRPAACVDPDRW